MRRTFADHGLRRMPVERAALAMLRLRRETRTLRTLDLDAVVTHADDARRVLLIKRSNVLLALNFSDEEQSINIPFGGGPWKALLRTDASLKGSTIITLPPAAFGVWAAEV